MHISAWFAFLHKWLALIAGIQIFFWVGTGLFFAVVPIEAIHGDHNVAEQEEIILDEGYLRADLGQAVATYAPDGVRGAELRTLLGQSIYDITRADGSHVLVDTRSGGLVRVDEAAARAVANADFAGSEEIARSTLVTERRGEYRGPVPAWRFEFADDEHTRIYVEQATGRLRARRNAEWRIYDFLWMLHIMDYKTREDFNHPLIITAASLAFLTVLMGVALFFWRLRLRDWRVMFRRR